jgi:hypothetical protein
MHLTLGTALDGIVPVAYRMSHTRTALSHQAQQTKRRWQHAVMMSQHENQRTPSFKDAESAWRSTSCHKQMLQATSPPCNWQASCNTLQLHCSNRVACCCNNTHRIPNYMWHATRSPCIHGVYVPTSRDDGRHAVCCSALLLQTMYEINQLKVWQPHVAMPTLCGVSADCDQTITMTCEQSARCPKLAGLQLRHKYAGLVHDCTLSHATWYTMELSILEYVAANSLV